MSRVFVRRDSKELNLHLLQTTMHVKDKDWQVLLLSCAFADGVGEAAHSTKTASLESVQTELLRSLPYPTPVGNRPSVPCGTQSH